MVLINALFEDKSKNFSRRQDLPTPESPTMTSLKVKSSLELVLGARVLLLLEFAWLAPAPSFEFDGDFNFKLICKKSNHNLLSINLSTTLVEKLLQFHEFYSHFIRSQSASFHLTIFLTYLCICSFQKFEYILWVRKCECYGIF